MTDIVTIFKALNSLSDLIIEFTGFQPSNTVWYGLLFQNLTTDLASKTGFKHEYTGPFGGDRFIAWAIGDRDECRTIINETIKICDSLFTGNSQYEKMYAEVDDVIWEGDLNWRVAKFVILCSQNRRQIYA